LEKVRVEAFADFSLRQICIYGYAPNAGFIPRSPPQMPVGPLQPTRNKVQIFKTVRISGPYQDTQRHSYEMSCMNTFLGHIHKSFETAIGGNCDDDFGSALRS
jgi:hypothetical protein